MVLLGECFAWRLAAALLVGLGVPTIGWAGDREPMDAPPAVEWIRGVPRGCRLVSFEVHSRKSDPSFPGSRVDVVWSYATSEDQCETAVLLRDLEILALESPASPRTDKQLRRGTVAVTPQQADRLRVAAACGGLGIADATEYSLRPAESRPAWDIQAIEDRTEGIEARLASVAADTKRLERPTLAAPPRISSGGVRRVITVPVEP